MSQRRTVMSDVTLTQTDQYLTFTLDQEIFALDIGTVREVLELTDITRIPRMPDHMRGVINLRGHAVPVVDMRKKFNLSSIDDTVDTCIIITEVETSQGRVIMGGLVDAVREVLELPPDTLEAPPSMGTSVKQEYIRAMGRQAEDFVIILDGAQVFTAEELEAGELEADDKAA
jgi:purine-binding chemotaxis protein CheW